MMRHFFLCFLLCTSAFGTEIFRVGQRDYVLEDTARSRKINLHVWYPGGGNAKMVPVIEKTGKVFLPVVSAMGAPLVKAPKEGFPVVVLSHGSMGLASRLFWLVDPLVRNGTIVVGVDHPGNMTGDSTAAGAVQQWDRAADLSFALDKLVETPEFKGKVDMKKIGAAGHSAGATTVLLLGGAKLSHAKFSSPTPKCKGSGDPYFEQQCKELEAIDYKSYPKSVVEKDYTDKRLRAVVAFDPGFARAFQPDSFKSMTAKPMVLVAEKLAIPQDEIYSKDFAKLLPPSSVEIVPNSFHMTFINACKPGMEDSGEVELKVLCAGNKEKLRIQMTVAQTVVKFFHDTWGNSKKTR